ncbi:helix-turn-helix transcriptional regulator [Burkholderia pseudomallei]|uniref:helix-turn-helix transcriptional regulator n=1 Tax=Burkholderia pseudomallei TaxID=28450 RepID=UPI00104C8B01|nr:helix-turn-helix transcriptional regulator [Burkholderia pseudomallei]QBL77963.1 AraC family transcriptional regulator [Burkholderia pseudomallei]
MFSMLYFPMVSALSLLGADAPTHLHSHLKLILGGEFNAALERSSEWAETTVASERTSWDLQLHADLQLVLGFEVEAEENYRRAQRRIRGSNSKIRIATCRNAAWQALFRYRVTTALACFSRICDEPGIEAGGLVEARFGIACALYEMGRIDDAFDAIDSMEKIAEQQSDEMRAYWKDLIAVLRFDLVVQSELRRAAAFVDHVYWQSAQSMSRVDRAHGVSEAAVSVETPLLRGRVAYLLQLRCAAAGNRDAVAELARCLDAAGEQGFVDFRYTLRLEIALALLAGDAPNLAQFVLEPISDTLHGAESSRRYREYFYCAAKVHLAQDHTQESLALYRRYALIAMRCLREDALIGRQFLVGQELKQLPQSDDVTVRLPLKYRRAYHYILQNLNRSDLSVREIAAEIGVTERALQNAFKIYLGLSPRELIRSRRMERIRTELVDFTLTGERNVKEAARKWGVQNGSTLVIAYRKEYDETPSETLAR